MKQLETVIRQIFFYGSFILLALAVIEKLTNLFGYTLLRGYYTPWRLLEFTAVALLFVIVLQLRQTRIYSSTQSSE